MRRLKHRRGGLDIEALSARIAAGDTRPLRALGMQHLAANTLALPFRGMELASKPDGAGGTALRFSGYASVTEVPFQTGDMFGEFTTILRAGCFTKTLSEAPDVIFCVNHDWDATPMARTSVRIGCEPTLRLSADASGLHVEANLDAARPDVAIMSSAIDRGELDAMSFAFQVTRQEWSPDYEQRDIQEVCLDGGDVSVVTHPANPATTGTINLHNARTLLGSCVPALLGQAASAETRAGGALSDATLDALRTVLELVTATDGPLDAVLPALAELMGVGTPDTETESSGATQIVASDSGRNLSLARAQARTRSRRAPHAA